MSRRRLSKSALLASASLAAAAAAAPSVSVAQEATNEVAEIIVTGTRRSETVQDAPINISAVGGEQLEALGIENLREAVRQVPGVFIVDQGPRAANRIIVRGLNADPLAASEGVGQTAGGTVATYLGEIPLYIDLRLNDIERVEFLLGPQGTLYGAGTLGGAIRFIPNRPSFTERMLEVRGDAYMYEEAEDVSTDVGLTFNFPFSDTFAVRGSIDRLDDSGFIDYLYVVREPGVSDPQPDLNDLAATRANLHRVDDANTEETLSGRFAARWAPTDWFDATLTYYFQEQEVGARQISHHRGLLPAKEYEATLRVLEPNDRKDELVSLEATLDLGFAELTSATGFSRYTETGQRDQSDLLIGLEYSYESFPSFTAFTREDQEDETFTQEVRLVSKSEGPFSWIVGAFYNKLESNAASREFTPGYAEFLAGDGTNPRPDSLEYFSVDVIDLKETALYGEASYRLTEAWQVTAGVRRYEYELKTRSAVDFPLFNSVFGGEPPDAITLNFEDGGQEDDGFLYKFNTSYDFTDDILGYLTISEGYRIGNSNGVAPCPDPLPPNQIACGLPNELQYFPDKTLNYELGLKSTLYDGRLVLNGAVYFIEWKDPQVSSATENGLIPITVNGTAAESKGLEINFNAQVTDELTIRGAYAYTKAELTERTERLIPFITPPGFQGTIDYADGEPGDRLPGSPEQQFALSATYTRPLPNGLDLEVNYGLVAVGDVLTRTGGRGGGITLDGYSLHTASVGVNSESWGVTLYIDNLFDEFVESGARGTPAFNQTVFNADGDPVAVRTFYNDVLPPRQVGIRFHKRFGG
jgi:iron complex outermembrane recepter protein